MPWTLRQRRSATVEADSKVTLQRDVKHDWPYRCDSHIELIVEDLDRAPRFSVLPGAENLERWLKTRKGYRKLTKEQYDAACRVIRGAGGRRPSRNRNR